MRKSFISVIFLCALKSESFYVMNFSIPRDVQLTFVDADIAHEDDIPFILNIEVSALRFMFYN